MNTFDWKKDGDFDGGEEVYSKPVRAGRRTYFFDVKATRNDDYYLTITESRKKQGKDGSIYYDKHKLFLYKEDFQKFAEGFEEVVAFVKEHKPDFFEHPERYASIRSRQDDEREADTERAEREPGHGSMKEGMTTAAGTVGAMGTFGASSPYPGASFMTTPDGTVPLQAAAMTADEEFDSL